MLMSAPLDQHPAIWLDKIIEVRYRAPRGIKYQQVSYCSIEGAGIYKGLLTFTPSKLTINGAIIKELDHLGSIWESDAESDNKNVKVGILNGRQVHHQTALRQFGLPKDVNSIIESGFVFRDNFNNLIAGTISSINFVEENGKKLIQLAPRNNVSINHLSKQWKQVSYFQMTGENTAVAYHKKSDLCAGVLTLV